MNKYISLIMMTRLLNLPYIDKYGGVVQTIQKVIPDVTEQGKSVIKRIPISAVHQAPENCSVTEATSIHFIPEGKLKGLLYFEDGGSVLDSGRRHSGLNFWRSRLRLIVWLNQKKLSEDFNIELASIAMNEMINLLCTTPANYELFKNVTARVANIPPATSSLFSQYDYNEKETQFLMPPYDFFGVDLDVFFGIPKKCKVPFVPDAVTC